MRGVPGNRHPYRDNPKLREGTLLCLALLKDGGTGDCRKASHTEYVQDITEKAIRLGQAAGCCACPGMKNIGKPCTGKPYARFDEGGLVKAPMDWLLRHRQTKGAETDRLIPNDAGVCSLLYPELRVMRMAFHSEDMVAILPT